MNNFVGMIHIVIRNQKCPPLNQDASTSHQTQRHNDSRGLSQGPKGPTQHQNQRHPIFILKSMITHQLKSSPKKVTIYDLLQTSKAHRDALMEVLKSIEVKAQDVEAFPNFMGHVQSCDLGAITFYEHGIIELRLLVPHPPLFIIAFMEG